jgi:outer membrane protein insertion porin family
LLILDSVNKISMSIRFLQSILILSFIISLVSCSNTRYLAEDETLFVGAKINIQDTSLSKKAKNNIAKYLENSVRPVPNKTFLSLRWKLWVYNVVGTPKRETGGLRNFIRNKIGEPPVLGEELNLKTNDGILVNQLQNIGYLRSEVTSKVEPVGNKKIKAIFNITANQQYKINDVKFPKETGDESDIASDITSLKGKTLLKKGDAYNLEVIKNERIRIDNLLKNKGYYFFNPEYILMRVDTGEVNHQVNIHVNLKWDEMPRNSYEKYKIKEVLIFPNYLLNNTKDTITNKLVLASDTLILKDNVKVIDPVTFTYKKNKAHRKRTYNSNIFNQAIELLPGDIFNQKDHNLTLNRLVNMGIFKFVKSDIDQVRSTNTRYSTQNMNADGDAQLNISYFLTPYPKKQLNGEVNGFTQNDSRAGSRASIMWRNRNALRGGELFSIKLTGGFEIQYGSEAVRKRPNTYNLGFSMGLNIPRLIAPTLSEGKPRGNFIPRTLINIDYNYSRRGTLYTINSFTLGWGYNWKEDIMRDHKLFPLSLGIVRTDTLDKNAQINVNLSNLVFNGIILGSTYEYLFNSKANGNSKKLNYYINVNADVAGNALGLINGTTQLQSEAKTLFGSPYAQYAKIQLDGRIYYQLNPKLELAARNIIGVGLPYGNSTSMPNIKQFFAGGSNSLRGFASRLVGPGTYNYRTKNYIETLGDFKFEFNAEARQKLYKFIDLGLFIDAGNIWLLRDNPNFPGGKLSKTAHKELAVDVGLGLRLDFSILILRLDFAGPIRKPYLADGHRWQIGGFNPLSAAWRQDNLFFNLAIGLPF